jgi:hypothetical protein
MPPKILQHLHYMKRDLEILYQLYGDCIPVIVKAKTMVPYQALSNWFQYTLKLVRLRISKLSMLLLFTLYGYHYHYFKTRWQANIFESVLSPLPLLKRYVVAVEGLLHSRSFDSLKMIRYCYPSILDLAFLQNLILVL